MKKGILFISSLVLLALAGCNKESNVVPDPSASGELAVLPMNGGSASRMTKGYVEESTFVETYYSSLHSDEKVTNPRTMQLSAYLTPQNGEAKNYFVDKTYSKDPSSGTTWWNTNIVGGDHDPIYWPVGGVLDFLAYSVSSEESGAGKSQNIKTVWDNTNAAQKVTLTVPGENTQNDILFASAYGVESKNGATPVAMTFNHAQAWLEFVLTGSVTDANAPGGAGLPIVNVKRIELENVYNAGTLNITNNGGNATAKWDFTGEDKQNISVDNFNENLKLTGSPKYLDMLIPQQTKTAFVIYYTLGSDTKELSYRFTTDQKTWLMGEKYIYKINITTSEVTIAPVVTPWSGPVQGFEYTVKTPATTVKYGEKPLGKVNVSFSPSAASFKKESEETDGSATYTCDTWGAQVTLTATPEADAVFVKWSDDVTENPRTFTITESGNLPEALFGFTVTIAPTEFGKITINGEEVSSLKVIPDSEVTLKATTGSTFKFKKWGDENTDATRTVKVTENVTYTPYFEVGVDYVEIAGLKWATQNLAITESGNKYWAKCTNVNDREIFRNGDYFQWGAYAGYCGDATDADKGLLVYKSFTSTACGDDSDAFVFKEGKAFNTASVPYYNGSKYIKYNSVEQVTLEPDDDVAHIIKGGDWRMPTAAEFQALYDVTYWAQDPDDRGFYVFAPDESHKAGSRAKSVPSDLKKYNALLFFPHAASSANSAFENPGERGKYWASSLNSDSTKYGFNLSFSLTGLNPQGEGLRTKGFSVRPVLD